MAGKRLNQREMELIQRVFNDLEPEDQQLLLSYLDEYETDSGEETERIESGEETELEEEEAGAGSGSEEVKIRDSGKVKKKKAKPASEKKKKNKKSSPLHFS